MLIFTEQSRFVAVVPSGPDWRSLSTWKLSAPFDPLFVASSIGCWSRRRLSPNFASHLHDSNLATDAALFADSATESSKFSVVAIARPVRSD